MIDGLQMLGLTGMVLVLAGFAVRNWIWLYAFNLAGTVILDAYALMRGDAVFAALESSIAVILFYRLVSTLRQARRHEEGGEPRDTR